MCSNSKKQCTLTTIKILGILLITNLLLTVLGIEYSPLYWIANFTYDSLPLVQGTELVNSNIEKWGIRGQIGDIMSGHFSALAVLAVAYSIILQVEANQKMTESIEKQKEALKHTEETILQQKLSIEKQTEANLEQAKSTLQQAQAIELQAKSIEQQNEALKVQSETLKAQIEELTESRKESEKQTEEFFIQNLNTKLDRYYKLVDFNLDLIMGETIDVKMKIINILDKDSKDYNEKDANSQIRISYKVFIILEHIYKEIKSLESNPHYKMFLNEFRIKIHTNFFIETLCINSSKEQKETYSFLKEYDYHFAFKQKTTEADS